MKVLYSNSRPNVCNGSTSINLGFIVEKVEVSQVPVLLFRLHSVKFYSIMSHILSSTNMVLNIANNKGRSHTGTQSHSTVRGQSKQLATLIRGYQNPKYQYSYYKKEKMLVNT